MMKKFQRLLFFLALSLINTYIFWIEPGLHHGDDLAFHMTRSISLSNIFTSPVNFQAFRGGLIVNSFYPWMTLLPMTFLQKILGLFWGYKIFYALLSFLTLCICYHVGERMKGERFGLYFALLYTFSTYRSINLFERAATGETIAMAFLPLVFYGFYEIVFNQPKRWPYMAFGVTLILYSHVITSAYTVFILFIMALVLLPRLWREKIRLWAIFKAAGLSLLMSLVIFIPMLEQARFQALAYPRIYDLTGENVMRVLIGIMTNDLTAYTIGPFMALMMVILMVRFQSLTTFEKTTLLIGASLVLMTTSLFPWLWMNDTPLRNIQFTWRLNGYAVCFISAAFAGWLSQLKLWSSELILRYLTGILVIFHIITLSQFYINSAANPDSWYTFSYESQEDFVRRMNLPLYWPDYASANSMSEENSQLIIDQKVLINQQSLKVPMTLTSNQVTYKVENTSEYVTQAILPVFRYAGQVVTVNGKAIETSLSELGTTALGLKPGTSTVTVSYVYTSWSKLSAIISFMSWLGFFLYRSREFKKFISGFLDIKQIKLFKTKEPKL